MLQNIELKHMPRLCSTEQNPKINQRQIERLQKLEEYKKKKAAEKEAAEKNKKKPFVVGKVRSNESDNKPSFFSKLSKNRYVKANFSSRNCYEYTILNHF